MTNEKKHIQPYQILFPIGIAHALMGSLVWILFSLHMINYPGPLHTHYMITGFLLSFATGFLLTAIPQFTGTARCNPVELSIATALSLLSLVFVHPIFTVIQLLFIVFFAARRISARAFNPPPYFIFLPVGLAMGILGATMLLLIQYGFINTDNLLNAKLFLYYGMMLSFVLGIGAKLIAALLGWAPLPNQLIQITTQRPSVWSQMKLPVILAILFLSSFILESFLYISPGRILRASCATWIAIAHWKIYKYPRNRGNFSFWIFVSTWMLVCGLWVHALWPQLDIQAAHLIFIGGFALMTFMVATRVSLAHGGYSLEIEVKSRALHVAGICILLAMATRVTAAWTATYTDHLAYAAFALMIAILSWSIIFVPKMIFRNGGIQHKYHERKEPKDSSC